MTDTEQAVVESVLDNILPDGGDYETRGGTVIITDDVSGRSCHVNVDAVRQKTGMTEKMCTLDELADYTRSVANSFYQHLQNYEN